MSYCTITENDISKWSDKTGELYHFPSRYLKYLQPGTKVVYYKGKMTDKKFQDKRLSPNPHYFGFATIGKQYLDSASPKNDYFCEIENYIPFSRAVPFKIAGEPIEQIPESRASNYWRDGVRPISKDVYDRILDLAAIDFDNEDDRSATNDLNQGREVSHESLSEGNKKERFTSYYERNPKLRQQAVLIHGYSCHVCGFNFKEVYGEHGEGYIHVHHLKPISETEGEQVINPKNDLAVLCANCHAMIHRYRSNTLSIKELRSLIG